MEIDRAIELKEELDSLDWEIQKRWEDLIGLGCGYFSSWEYCEKDETLIIHSSLHGNDNDDKIPKRFFKMEPTTEDKNDGFVYRKNNTWRIKEALNKWFRNNQEEKKAGKQQLLKLNS